MRDYKADYQRKLKDCLYWMTRAKRAEAKVKAAVAILTDNRTDAQAIMGYPAISNTVEL